MTSKSAGENFLTLISVELEMGQTGGITPSVPMFMTGVGTGSGMTVLIVPNARPRSPSPEPEENEEESLVAHSTAWLLIEMPPTVTVSYR